MEDFEEKMAREKEEAKYGIIRDWRNYNINTGGKFVSENIDDFVEYARIYLTQYRRGKAIRLDVLKACKVYFMNFVKFTTEEAKIEMAKFLFGEDSVYGNNDYVDKITIPLFVRKINWMLTYLLYNDAEEQRRYREEQESKYPEPIPDIPINDDEIPF